MRSIKHRHIFTASGSSAAFSALIAVLILFLISSCAQVVPPGGGPRDNKPPRVIKYIPDSAQLNFNAKYIVLEFDEYIQLKDLNNQLIISPPFEKNPEVKVKNKTMTIDLSKQKLLPNTTYSINFGNALQDNNEGNASENFNYLFSTGSYIDSLSIQGKVETAFDHKTEKGLLVMLYSDTDDSAIYKSQPDYFGKTIADGTFRIGNIRPGKYKIYALKDGNANFKFNDETENIGFLEGIVDPLEQTDTTKKDRKILIETFQQTPKKVFLKKYVHNSYGKISLYFSRGSDSIRVKNIGDSIPPENIILDFSKNKDTLTYWIKNYDKDSLKLQVSNDTSILDTVEFKLIKKEDALKAKKNPLRLSVISSPAGNQSFDLNSFLKLTFSQPIESIDYTKEIELREDSVLMKGIQLHPASYKGTGIHVCQWDSTSKAEDPNFPGVTVIAPSKVVLDRWKENTNYHLLILPGTFTNIFGQTNDSIKIDFKTREQKYYGTLKLKVDVPETPGGYIVQLMDEKETVIREKVIYKSETIDFEYLYPNKYKIKLIYDTNGNKKWDTGNYLEKRQAERVIYNQELITIRSNWDADIEWKILAPDKE